jgi:N-acetylmuramoyl-L-alanine amidase
MTDLRSFGGLNLLTALVWGEAEGEPFLGKLAVACVVRNRVVDRRWPDTFEDVILQPQQFSCFNLDEPRHHSVLNTLTPSNNFNDRMWRECRLAAFGVLNNWVQDVTKGSNHYHTVAVHPNWSQGHEPEVAIGAHLFFRL